MEPWELGLAESADLIRSGKLSPVELTTSLLRRIEALEPQVQAWVTVDAEGALLAARRAEARRSRGPLAGVPVGLKDIFYTRGMRTTADSRALADFVPDYDATSVARLRRAGAIILGKLHTAEFAARDPAPTRNPWNTEHTPGGSSSGSGAAVAAGMVAGATGTQTAGSVNRPAAFNGIVGFKPTYGLISCYGVIAYAWSLDTVGALARSVLDAALLVQVMAGPDPNDPASAGRRPGNYVKAAQEPAAPPRLGLVRDYFLEQCDPEVRRHTEAAAERLARAGARVEEVRLPPSFAQVHAEQEQIAESEAAAAHEALFKERGHLYGPLITQRLKSGFARPAYQYAQAMRNRLSRTRDLEATIARADALLTPASLTPPPQGLSSTGSAAFQVPWTYAGVPTITLPSSVTNAGLPLAVQLIGPRWGEERLLRIARWCEQALDFRARPPLWR